MGEVARGYLNFIVPIAIGFLPILLHIADKGMERFSPIRETVLQELMKQDARDVVKAVGESADGEFDAVKTYFDFERKCHFVIALAVFNILSIYVAQTECTKNLLCATWITLVEMIALAIMLVVFLLGIANRVFPIAAVTAVETWVKISIGAFGLVMITEIVLHFVPSILDVSCA
jgi:hypothetical protein